MSGSPYYVRNFEAVLETVGARDAGLLTERERALVEGFGEWPEGARRLWVRLIARRGPCFRRDGLDYPEIDGLGAAAESLEELGWLTRDLRASRLEEVLGVLVVGELRALARGLGRAVPSRARRAEWEAALCVEPEEVWEALAGRYEVWRPQGWEVVAVLRALFFGNVRQGLEEFVLRDLGVVRYEDVSLEASGGAFATREELEDALALGEAAARVEAALEGGALEEAWEVAEAVVARSVGWEGARRRRADRVVVRVGRALERAKDWGRAEALYRGAWSPPARERRARVLVKLGREDEALEVCEEVEAGPLDATEAEFAPGFAARVRRARGEDVPRVSRRKRPGRVLELVRAEGQRVERQVLAHFAGEGRRGIHGENWVWSGLFGLVGWDVIFAPVRGAFTHPFQRGPRDLFSPRFRGAREEVWAERLEALRGWEDLGARLLPVYEAKEGIANWLVDWTYPGREVWAWILSVLDGASVAAVLERLSRDPGRYRRGLPDLLVERGGGFELLEVKAPGDALRAEQGAWIDALNAAGVTAEVLTVRWVER